IGSGAREHAIAAALARSPQQPELLCFGSAHNPGIAALTRAYTSGNITDAAAVVAFALEHNPTLAIIGPTQSLARIESSKSFTRSLLDRHHIAGNPIFQRFTSLDGVEAFLDRLG